MGGPRSYVSVPSYLDVYVVIRNLHYGSEYQSRMVSWRGFWAYLLTYEDYKRFIQGHRETDADITVVAMPMDEQRATAFGLMKIDEEGCIVEFAEKPKGDQLKSW